MRFKDSKIYTTEKLSPRKEKTPEGFLLCKDVAISRTGNFEYSPEQSGIKPNAIGKCFVSRSEEELFNPETIASFEGKPVVIGHSEFVDPSNWQRRSIGVLKNVRRGEGERSDQLLADLLLTAQNGIDLVEGGTYEEVSCGYDAQVIDDGNGQGHIRGIVGNHLAIVKEGRCGSTCRIMDEKMTPSLKTMLRRFFKDGNEEGFNETLDTVEITAKDEEEAQPEKAEATATPEPEVSRLDAIEKQLASILEKFAEIDQRLNAPKEEHLADEEEPKEGEAEEEKKEEVADEDEEAVNPDEAKQVIADAEELCEGIQKPTADSKDGRFTVNMLERLKRNAIKKSGFNQFGDSVDGATGELLDAYFKGTLATARASKNPKFKIGDSKMTQPSGRKSNAELNAMYNKFWSNK